MSTKVELTALAAGMKNTVTLAREHTGQVHWSLVGDWADRLDQIAAQMATSTLRAAADAVALVEAVKKLTPSDHPRDKRALIVSRYWCEKTIACAAELEAALRLGR